MAAEARGATPTTPRGKNHNGAREWQQRLEATKQRVQQAIAAMQKDFVGVTEPSERRPLNGKPGEVFTITPEAIVKTLSFLDVREEASRGNPDRDLAAIDTDGNAWTVAVDKTGSVKFQRFVKPGETPSVIGSIHYIPRREQYISGNGNGQVSRMVEEPTTLKIVGKGQELVFKAPVKDEIPSSVSPS